MRSWARRFISTQSKVLFFIADDFGWSVDGRRIKPVDEVHSIVERDFIKVDDVFEVPIHGGAATMHAGGSDVLGVSGPFRSNDSGVQVWVAQSFGAWIDEDGFGLS